MKSPILNFSDDDTPRLKQLIADTDLRLTPGEARRLTELLNRNPTRVEAVLFDTLWSEHCSYKSSRSVLKKHLTTEGPHVILGPGEDAGAVYFTTHAGERWALVVAHESHNHPSQVVPFEGAATGVGGVVRDVYCMGANVVGVLDGLRFGSLEGPNGERSREIARGVVDGIWHYANALGVPNLGGDAVFDSAYDDNCLVNVVAVGMVKEQDLVRSRVPKEARESNYSFVLVGKPTDASGFGGASFASAVLDEEETESNKGAVQVPDPFLKRMLSEANRAVLDLVRREGVAIGFKDLGAGGIACATSELADAGGFGADIELSAVSIDGGPYPPEVIACSETQERYCLVVPQHLTRRILQIYNLEFELPQLYPGARAQVIGRVRTDDTVFRMTHEGDVVVDAPVSVITEGILYEREAVPAPDPVEPSPPAIDDLSEALSAMMEGSTLGSREAIYRYYDSEVQSQAVLRPGEADASVLLPVEGSPAALAVSIDGNPFIGALDAYQGGAASVAEAMRNVAAVGATPWCLTDCLNFGNPEVPEVFHQFCEGVRGLGDAARGIGLHGEDSTPVPIVSGNVSFYNQSAQGQSIPPSPIVACFGVMADYSKVVTPHVKNAGDVVVLLGQRSPHMGGSALWRKAGVHGGKPAQVDFGAVRAELHVVLDSIEAGRVSACHDISEGGLAGAAAEMLMRTELGMRLQLDSVDPAVNDQAALFGEAGGFLLTVPEESLDAVLRTAEQSQAAAAVMGKVERDSRLVISRDQRTLLQLSLDPLRESWQKGLKEALA